MIQYHVSSSVPYHITGFAPIEPLLASDNRQVTTDLTSDLSRLGKNFIM